MLSQNQFTNRIRLMAQAETGAEGAPEASTPSLTGVSLFDSTRLGPYSTLLKDAFEQSQAEQALQLKDSASGADIIAIGRSLSPEEKQQGLSQQLVTREKIALIVDANNPFQGTLTLEQIEKIFRGEITNWQQVGGDDRPLTLVHRPDQNLTRQSLQGYPVFGDTTFAESGIDPQQDSTAVVLEAIGVDGISYAPASETIEQFNARVVPIDNVGVNDGRYPFSQQLNFVYKTNPTPEVQGFLDFLAQPDAQAAVEFAQSQPADPTRGYRPADLSELIKQAAVSSGQPTPPPTETIPATPLDPPTSSTSESPSPDSGIGAGTAPSFDGSVWSWIPIVLIFLLMGVLGWLAYMRSRLERSRPNDPRPAPDYSSRLKAQGSNRDMDELKAIAAGPMNVKSPTQTLEKPDLSLSKPVSTQETPTSSVQETQTPSGIDLQTSDANEVAKIDQVTQAEEVTPDGRDFSWGDNSASSLEDEDLTMLQNTSEDLTMLQNTVVPGTAGADLADSDDFSELEEQDITILQTSNATPDPHRDSLTGQLTEELEALSDLNESKSKPSTDSLETRASGTQQDDGAWNDVTDPWE